MSADHFDLIVIGGGPAGYVGAIKQLLAHGASATKVPVVAKRVKRRRCLEHPE